MTALRQRMLRDMGIRNLAANTQLSCLQQVSAFANDFHRSPEALGPEQVRQYQVHLVEDRKLAASSICIAVSALRILYKVTLKQPWAPDDIPMPKKPFKLPLVLRPEEVLHFLSCVHSLKHRTILTTTYAAGLRVCEVTHLKVTFVGRRLCVTEPSLRTVRRLSLDGHFQSSNPPESRDANDRFQSTTVIARRPFVGAHSPKESPTVLRRWPASDADRTSAFRLDHVHPSSTVLGGFMAHVLHHQSAASLDGAAGQGFEGEEGV